MLLKILLLAWNALFKKENVVLIPCTNGVYR